MSTAASDAAPANETSPVGAASYLVALREAVAPPAPPAVDGARVKKALREAAKANPFAKGGGSGFADEAAAKAAIAAAAGKPNEAAVKAAAYKAFPKLKPGA